MSDFDMPRDSKHISFNEAVFEAVRDMLLEKVPVQLPGIGRFEVVHVAAEIEMLKGAGVPERTKSDPLAVHPPQDTLSFQGESLNER